MQTRSRWRLKLLWIRKSVIWSLEPITSTLLDAKEKRTIRLDLSSSADVYNQGHAACLHRKCFEHCAVEF
jgi:hypothetical protein